MSSEKKPKPDPFCSVTGDEFIREQPAKGWEPPPPDPPPDPVPPPTRPRIAKEECAVVFHLVAFLHAYAFVREKGMTHFPSQMRKGLSLEKVKAAFKKAGVTDIDSLPQGIYANQHVSGIRKVSHAVVSVEIEDMVQSLVAPELSGSDRDTAVSFFRRLVVACHMRLITQAELLEDPEEATPPGTPRPPLGPTDNPWGNDD